MVHAYKIHLSNDDTPLLLTFTEEVRMRYEGAGIVSFSSFDAPNGREKVEGIFCNVSYVYLLDAEKEAQNTP